MTDTNYPRVTARTDGGDQMDDEEAAAVDRLLDAHAEPKGDYPDSAVGCCGAALETTIGVEAVDVGDEDGRDAVAVRIHPGRANLDAIRVTARVDHGLTLIREEWDGDEGHLLRIYAERAVENSRAWHHATEELIDLSRDHSPAEVLDYWILERGAPDDATTSHSAWGRHRGVSQQAVSKNVAALRESRDDE
jgi:hypothetical protein